MTVRYTYLFRRGDEHKKEDDERQDRLVSLLSSSDDEIVISSIADVSGSKQHITVVVPDDFDSKSSEYFQDYMETTNRTATNKHEYEAVKYTVFLAKFASTAKASTALRTAGSWHKLPENHALRISEEFAPLFSENKWRFGTSKADGTCGPDTIRLIFQLPPSTQILDRLRIIAVSVPEQMKAPTESAFLSYLHESTILHDLFWTTYLDVNAITYAITHTFGVVPIVFALKQVYNEEEKTEVDKVQIEITISLSQFISDQKKINPNFLNIARYCLIWYRPMHFQPLAFEYDQKDGKKVCCTEFTKLMLDPELFLKFRAAVNKSFELVNDL